MSKSFDNTSYVLIFSLKRKSITILYRYICPFIWEYGENKESFKILQIRFLVTINEFQVYQLSELCSWIF